MARTYSEGVLSFRDPGGRLVVIDGRILRWISAGYRNEFEAYLGSQTAQRCIRVGQIVSHRVLSSSEATALVKEYQLTECGGLSGEDLVVEHDRIPFSSFPYEWPSEMLEAAGLLTLDLAQNFLDEGLGLKDATPYNVLFRGPEPVFVDVLSIERRDPLEPVWLPYAQFVRTFLLPLVLHQRFGIPIESSLLGRRDGVEPEEVYRICGPLAKLRPPILTLATLPTVLSSRGENRQLYRKRQGRSAEEAGFVLRSILSGLRRQLARLKVAEKSSSRWSGYVETCESYGADQLKEKTEFIAHVLTQYPPIRLLDAGCNTGQFSLQAARTGTSVVAIDSDAVVVGRLWRQARAERLDILPLVINLARPSPAVGWKNAECPAFLDRAKAGFDMVFFLAILHHLLISERIPLTEVISLVAELTTDLAVIEFVGTEDPMFQRLSRGREALYEQLTKSAFEAAVLPQFDILSSKQLTGSSRHLYLLKKRSSAAIDVM